MSGWFGLASSHPQTRVEKSDKDLGSSLEAVTGCRQSGVALAWPHSFADCGMPVVVEKVGELCLTLSWQCSSERIDDWLPRFLLRHQAQLTDVLTDGASVTVLGEYQEAYWRIHASEAMLVPKQTMVTFSVLETYPSVSDGRVHSDIGGEYSPSLLSTRSVTQ